LKSNETSLINIPDLDLTKVEGVENEPKLTNQELLAKKAAEFIQTKPEFKESLPVLLAFIDQYQHII